MFHYHPQISLFLRAPDPQIHQPEIIDDKVHTVSIQDYCTFYPIILHNNILLPQEHLNRDRYSRGYVKLRIATSRCLNYAQTPSPQLLSTLPPTY